MCIEESLDARQRLFEEPSRVLGPVNSATCFFVGVARRLMQEKDEKMVFYEVWLEAFQVCRARLPSSLPLDLESLVVFVSLSFLLFYVPKLVFQSPVSGEPIC